MLENLKNEAIVPLFLLGLLLAVPLTWKRREKIGMNKLWQVAVLCLASFIIGVIGQKIMVLIENLVLTKKMNMSMFGIFLIEPLILLLLCKITSISRRDFFDVLTIFSLPTMCISKIGCLISGCCGGDEILNTGLYWPTREAELLFFLIMFVVLLRFEKKTTVSGLMFPILMISYGCFRFVQEWVRVGEDLIMGFQIAHIWSVLTVIVGASIYFELRSQAARKAARRYGHRRN